MKLGQGVRKFTELGFAMTAIAALVAGCGGGGGGAAAVANVAAGTTLTGVVADGYLTGAKVCLDVNSNGVCDATEPFGTSAASGVYSINVPAGQATNFPVVAEVAANAIDADTASAVGQSFTLTAPAGASFVSPLTTLVQQKVAAGATSAAADAAVLQLLGFATPAAAAASGISAMDNYVAKKASAADQTNPHFRAHEAAKVVAAVFKQNKALLATSAVASTDLATQAVLATQAQSVLSAQYNALTPATMFNQARAVSYVSTAGTLNGAIARTRAVLVPAAATQAVNISFDVVNGASAVGTTGCVTPFTVGNAPASGVAPAGTVGTLQDLRFYVSNLSLVDNNGNYVPVKLTENANQSRGVALLDFETGTGTCPAATGTAATYTTLAGAVAPPAAGTTYVGIAFTVGVPQYSNDGVTPVVLLNHSNPTQVTADPVTGAPATPLPLQNSAMAWMWQSGRKFTKIEFTASAVAPALVGVSTLVHLGSTGCLANPAVATTTLVSPCGSPNNMQVFIPTGFNPAVNKVALDLGALFAGLDLTASKTWMSGKTAMNMNPGAMGGMGGMAATPVNVPAYFFNKFQVDLTTGQPINGGAAQTLFVIK